VCFGDSIIAAMADWQERVQSLIIGFVFGFMVVKLFSVISSFRAGNLRVARGSDVDDALLVPADLGPGDDDELSAPLLATDEETEADGGDELEEDRADGESSSTSSSDSEAEDEATAASRPREFDATATDEPTVPGVESKDVETSKEEKVEAKKDEEIEDVGKTESKALGDNSLKALVRLLAPSIFYRHSNFTPFS